MADINVDFFDNLKGLQLTYLDISSELSTFYGMQSLHEFWQYSNGWKSLFNLMVWIPNYRQWKGFLSSVCPLINQGWELVTIPHIQYFFHMHHFWRFSEFSSTQLKLRIFSILMQQWFPHCIVTNQTNSV